MIVSVITPVYNSAPYIVACMESLRAQTMKDFEVILVDDRSTDESAYLIRRWIIENEEVCRFRLMTTPRNSGPGIARNLGIKAARGNFIAFVDSDDVCEPTFLESLVNAIAPNASFLPPLSPSFTPARSSSSKASRSSRLTPPASFDMAYCQLKYRGGKRDGKVHRNPVLEAGDFTPAKKRRFLLHFVTFSVCFIFRKKFLKDNQLCFPSERNSEDTNFLTRCLLTARTIACVDEPLYVYCVHEQSLTTGRDPNRWRQRISAANKLMQEFDSMKHQPQLSDLRLSQYNLVMGILYLKKGIAQALLEFFR